MRIFNALTLEKIHSCSIAVPEYASWLDPWRGLTHAFSPNGEYYAVLLKGEVQLWRINDCTLAHHLMLDEILADCAYQTSQLNLIFSPDNQYLAFAMNPRNCGSQSEFARLWRVPEGELVVKEEGAHVAFSPDGSIIAIASFYEGPVHLWQIKEGELLQTVSAPEDLTVMFFSHDGSMISICGKKAIWIWQVSDGGLLKRLYGVRGCYPHFFTEDDQFIRAGDILWRLSDEIVVGTNPNELPWDPSDLDYGWSAEWPPYSGKFVGHINQVAFSPDGNYLGYFQLGSNNTTYAPGTFLIIDLNELNIKQAYTAEGGHDFTFSMDKFALSTGSKIEIRNLADGSLVRTFEVEESQSLGRHMVFSPDGTLLAVADIGSSNLGLWQVEDGSLHNSFSVDGRLIRFSYSPVGTQLFVITHGSGTKESLVALNALSGEITNRQGYQASTKIPGGTTGCTWRPIAISPDGRLLAFSGPECTIKVVRLSDWEVLYTLDVGIGEQGVIAFSPDGRLLATAFQGAEIKLWDVEDGTLVHTLIDHETPITEYPVVELAFSPDGKLLAVAGLGLVNLYGVWP